MKSNEKVTAILFAIAAVANLLVVVLDIVNHNSGGTIGLHAGLSCLFFGLFAVEIKKSKK